MPVLLCHIAIQQLIRSITLNGGKKNISMPFGEVYVCFLKLEVSKYVGQNLMLTSFLYAIIQST